MRPVDVTASEDDCTLEPAEGEHPFAVRMGLRYVKGLLAHNRERILAARSIHPFVSAEDLVHRTGLDERSLMRLADFPSLP